MSRRRTTRGLFGGFAKPGFLACLGVILYVVASTSGSGWLYVIAAGMGGVVVISVLGPLWSVRGIEVTRRSPRVGTAGEPLECALEVRNTKRLSRYLLELEDRFAGGAGRVVLAQVKSGQTGIGYTLDNPRRGIYSAGEVIVESGAPFGLVHRRRRIKAASDVVIHPRTFDVADLPLPLNPDAAGDDSESSAMHRGLGGDFWGVREYRPGDPARLIAWRRSARSLASDRLSVVELAHQTSPPLTVALDLDERAPEEVREMIVSAAASLMLHALREGRDVAADAGPQPIPFPENPDAEAVLTWCASLEASDSPGAGEVSVRLAPSLRDLDSGRLRGDTVVLVSCHDFAGTGAWMKPEEERSLLDGIEADERRAVLLGREVPEPWRLW